MTEDRYIESLRRKLIRNGAAEDFMTNRSRERYQYVYPRFVMMYCLKKLRGKQVVQTGAIFGKGHPEVLYANRVVCNMISDRYGDDIFKSRYGNIINIMTRYEAMRKRRMQKQRIQP